MLNRASQACILPNSDLKTRGGNCVLLFHRFSKTVDMHPAQHDVFALPCCVLPASLALRPSRVVSTRVILSWKSYTSFSMPTTVQCLATCLGNLGNLRVHDGLLLGIVSVSQLLDMSFMLTVLVCPEL